MRASARLKGEMVPRRSLQARRYLVRQNTQLTIPTTIVKSGVRYPVSRTSFRRFRLRKRYGPGREARGSFMNSALKAERLKSRKS